jgi:hypothetical protein
LLQYDFEHGVAEANAEAEYAFANRYAVEFELPIRDISLTAYKFSLQSTFSYPKSHHFIHGWQYIGEYFVDDKRFENTALYLFGHQFNEHWSTLNKVGIRRTDLSSKGYFEGLLNGSLFYSVSSNLAID